MIEGETNVFTLDEILARARVETVYTGSNPALHSSSHTTGENYLKTPGILSQMRVSSSINLFGKARGKQVQYNVETLGSENFTKIRMPNIKFLWKHGRPSAGRRYIQKAYASRFIYY